MLNKPIGIKSFQPLQKPFIMNPTRFAASFDLSQLKAYYPFNEASTPVINQSTSPDTLGTSADIVVTGGTFQQSGVIQYSLLFDGVDDYGTIGTLKSLFNFMWAQNHQWSFVAWIKKTNTPTSWEGIMSCTAVSTQDKGFGFTVYLASQTVTELVLAAGNKYLNDIVSDSGDVPNDTNWHLYVLTFDDTLASNQYNMYIDGNSTPVFTASYASVTYADGDATNLMLVGRDSATAKYLDGELCEMSVWNRVLTTDEISLLYGGGSGLSLV